MLSYLILAWNPREPRLCELATHILTREGSAVAPWHTALAAPGLRVLLPADVLRRPPQIMLRNDAGLILGTIFPFERQAGDHCKALTEQLPEADEASILLTRGRSMIRRYWGSYILLLRDQATSEILTLRGPMSALPCLWLQRDGLTIMFSCPMDLARLGIHVLGINWDHIRAQSVLGDYLCEETGLEGVRTLLSGDCLAIRSSRVVRQDYWNPASTGAVVSPRSFDQSATLLGSATRTAIASWGALHDSMIVSLSGGFDSSVLLSCLANSSPKPRLLAVNLYSSLAADERRYARSMAEHCNIPLTEIEMPLDVDLRVFETCTKTASPVLHFGAFVTEPIFERLSQSFGASAVATGELGDTVFGHAFGAELLADSLWRYRLTPRTLATAIDYAILNKISVWRAIALAVSEYRLYRTRKCCALKQRSRKRGAPAKFALASDEAVACFETMQDRFIHPWYRDVACAPPGLIQAAAGMIIMTSSWTQSAFSSLSDRLLLHPLTSQPLVEAFLTIPAHFHIHDSENAAVARKAFGAQLSRAVLDRGMGKGAPELWLRRVIGKNRRFVQEFLLEGVLVQKGILDRQRITLALSPNADRSQAPVTDIVAKLFIESWLRTWTSAGTGPNNGKPHGRCDAFP